MQGILLSSLQLYILVKIAFNGQQCVWDVGQNLYNDMYVVGDPVRPVRPHKISLDAQTIHGTIQSALVSIGMIQIFPRNLCVIKTR